MSSAADMDARPATHGPLAGLRIVEIDAIGPLPLAAMMLADMGAECVRITRPRTGNEAWDDVGGSVLHRGRAFVEMDLKKDRESALDLIASADAVIEGMRPGVMDRLGLGPDDCLAVNPALVYGRITGWGQSGPLAERAGHDINFIGLTGALGAIGDAGDPPPVPLNIMGDYGAGTMLLVTGVLAALLSAQRSGRGQVVDAAITDGLSMQCALYRAFLANGLWANERAANLLDGAAPYYRCYACADGKYLAVGALEPPFYRQFLTGLGLSPEDWPQDRQELWPEMAARFAGIIAGRTRAQWMAAFDGTDACVTPVLDWDEALTDPHLAARDTFATAGGVTQPSPAPRFAETPSAIRPAHAVTLDMLLANWARRQGEEDMR